MTEMIKVCDVDALPDGEALRVSAEKTGWTDGIAVFRDGGEFFALDDTCTHETASLAEGWIENGEVECPDHAARFSLATGAVLCDPATRAARTHHVEVSGGCVWLAVGVDAGTRRPEE